MIKLLNFQTWRFNITGDFNERSRFKIARYTQIVGSELEVIVQDLKMFGGTMIIQLEVVKIPKKRGRPRHAILLEISQLKDGSLPKDEVKNDQES